MTKILIDTNILVYGIDEDSAFFKRARKILDQESHQLVTTSKNLIEFLAVITKSIDDGKIYFDLHYSGTLLLMYCRTRDKSSGLQP